jgi:hypothetical protein
MTIRRPTKIHFSELPPSQPDSELTAEWETYRREVGRLIAEGNEGKWIFIKNETIIGIYDTDEEASDEARRRYLMQARLVHQIQTWEKVYCIRNHC